VESFIDLGDIVAGGDGTGTGSFAAVNIDSGFFLDRTTVDGLHADSIDTDGINPSPVVDSDLIDSVFFFSGDFSPINLEGVLFEFLLDEPWTGSYNHILANKTHDIDKGIEDVIAGGTTFDAGIGIHASAGITFDLEALRDTHGESAVGTLHTFAGVDGCGGNISLYVIYSDDEGIIEDPNANDARGVWTVRVQAGSPAEEYRGEIPPEARYVSLIVGGRNGIGCAHGVFANPRILPGEGGGEPKFVRGDADANGNLNLTDGIVVLNFLFVGSAVIPCQKAADSDDTGALNLTDGIYILQYLFSGGMDIPPPFESCGPDPTADGISCDVPHCL